MAGNVIPFPSGFSGGFASAPAGAQPSQAGTPVAPPAPPAVPVTVRLATVLELARNATLKLVRKAEPGSHPLGLFNQFGVIQNAVAALRERVQNNEDLGQDLEKLERDTAQYIADVDQAAGADPEQTQGLDKKKLLLIGGAGLLAVGGVAYLVLRKPARRRRIAGLLGMGVTAAAAKSKSEPAPARKTRPRRKARQLKKKR